MHSSKKKKKAIIEPLYKSEDPFREVYDPLREAALHVLRQEEFEQIFFPYPRLLTAIAMEHSLMEPILDKFTANEPFDPEEAKRFKHFLGKVLSHVLETYPEAIEDILETLEILQERAESENDVELQKDAQLVQESFQKNKSTKKLAQSSFLHEVILKQMEIFNQFNSELFERTGHNFEDVIDDKIDEEKLGEVIEEFDDRFEGFEFMLYGLDAQELFEGVEEASESGFEETNEIVNKGMGDLLNDRLFLNLFSKREIEEGLRIAEDMYKELPAKEKERLQKIGPDPYQEDIFRAKILIFIHQLLSDQRLEKMARKIEKYLENPKYEEWSDFLKIMYRLIRNYKQYEFVFNMLTDIYFAEVRHRSKQPAKTAHNFFW